MANARNLSVVCVTRKLCCTNESPKDGLGLQTDTRKSAYGNRIQWRCNVEALHRNEHRIDKKGQNLSWKRTHEVKGKFCAWKDHGEC